MDYNYFTAVISLILLIPLTSSTWSSWSDWSECSRTCDVGIAYRTRNCTAGQLCQGDDHTEFKTCSLQQCPDGTPDFRTEQCSKYNNQAYNGQFLQWSPEVDKDKPCNLICTAKEHGRKVTQNSIVLDGTSCSQHSRGICIGGTCKTIGCDDILDSGKAFDSCGVCGGDNSSCTATSEIHTEVSAGRIVDLTEDFKPVEDKSSKNLNHKLTNVMEEKTINGLSRIPQRDMPPGVREIYSNRYKNRVIEVPFYVWEESQYSECSVTCGVGKQQTKVTCKNPKTNEVVIDRFCTQQKPPHHAKTCMQRSCKAKWIAGRWSSCSSSCGGGISTRNVFCIMSGANGKMEKVDDIQCVSNRPTTKQKCNQNPCPEWQPGQWSKCSVTCGAGHQFRDVVCKRDSEAEECAASDKPVDKQRCHTGIICQGQTVIDHQNIDERPFGSIPDDNDITEDNRGGVGDGDNQLAFERPSVYDVYWGNPYDDDDDTDTDDRGESIDSDYYDRGGGFSWEEEYDNEIGGDTGRSEETGGGGDVDYRGNEILELEGGSGDENTVITTDTPRFVTHTWGPCDVTCGHGLRHRKVECKALIAYSNTVQVLPDDQCQETKPATSQRCIEENCPIVVVDSVSRNNYAWQFSGHGPCTATCGGGFREPLFKCVRSDPHTVILVATELCSRLYLPTILKESCNDFPCPARWNIYPYGPCSHPCGGGFSTREVSCVRDQGNGNVITVPEALCPDPIPSRSRLCNQVKCPPQWSTGRFSQCSATCGKGIQSRKVECKQIVHPNRDEMKLDDEFCPQGSKPDSLQPCQLEPCVVLPQIRSDSSYYVQLQQRKQLRFVAGGTVVIIPGTVLRIRCHVINFDKTKIVWTKNGHTITRRGRTKRSRRGVLHIRGVKATDAGVYTCFADNVSATTYVRIHSAQEALEKLRFRESVNSRDPEFLRMFHQVIKQAGPNRKEEYTEPFILRHFDNVDTMPFKFITTKWGRCSRSCGGAGLQSRQITCELNLNQYYLVVNDDYCYNKGFDKPLTTQDCGYQACPEWQVGEWESRCIDDHCLGFHEGARLRPLTCVDNYGAELNKNMCDRKKKPRDKQACIMETCEPKWIASDWTDCSITCGGQGIHTRSLRCVWEPNNKTANGMCDKLSKPDAIKPCQTPACDDTYCRDESNYCSLVQTLNLCRYAEYRTKCCASCTVIGRGPIRLRRYRFT